MGKWFLVIVLLLVAVLVAFGIFIATGVIDGPALFWKWGLKTPWLEPYLATYAVGQDAETWVSKRQGEFDELLASIQEREAALVIKADELEQRSQQLDKREMEIAKQRNTLVTEQAQRQNVNRLAELYTEMPADEVANILAKLETDLILHVLLAMDVQDAATILTKLPTNLAVTLSKQLGQPSK